MPSVDVFERAVNRWRSCSVPLLPPADDTDIVETFTHLDYPLSADVRRLYSMTGGFRDWETDDVAVLSLLAVELRSFIELLSEGEVE